MQNDASWKKFLFMTLIVIATAGILGVAGFYLWFVFPIERINGLTYMSDRDLMTYYGIINLLDVVGVSLLIRYFYFKFVRTSQPLRDGTLIGIYLLVFCWVTDILVYIFIRSTIPSVEEYFLGKNQPEIGIAWLIGFSAAVLAGWLEQHRRKMQPAQVGNLALISSSGLILISIVATVIGITFFDIRP